MKTEFERYYWICDAPGCYFVREHGVNFHLAKCTTQHTAEMIVNALYSDQQNKVTGETSDGYHTFNELYEHRHVLFLALLKTRIDAWKSWKHEDGSAFDGWFIAGIGDKITYHIPARLWDAFTVPEVANAPKWDGHTSNDVIEQLKLLDADQQNKELREENERLIAGIRRGQYLAENLKWSDDPNAEGFTANEKEIQRLTKEVEELKTVMIAAAEEIQAHWDAHCDEKGYGPTNLMHRLEKGIPSQYAYTAGAFMKQQELINGQAERITRLTKEVEELKLRLSGKTFFNPFEQENTRLRELLGRAKTYVTAKQLYSDIDNALNHKP